MAAVAWVAVGSSTERKNPAEMRIAASGTPTRTTQSMGAGRARRVSEHLTNKSQDHERLLYSDHIEQVAGKAP
jgi:hypothetical protein